MSKINDGGFAESFPGMTLRDWFAGQALTGMLTNPMYDDNHSANVAQQAYMQADAMLLEREKEPRL